MRSKLLLSLLVFWLAATLAGCDTLGPPLTRAGLGVERWRSDLVRREVSMPEGTRIVYLEGGRGEPLVLVHGFGGDKDNFTRVARWLTPHYRVIVPDLAGFGESAHRADLDYHYEAQAERVRAFVQALGLQRVHLGGNSMGGAIVLSYAARHPQEVGSLWLLDTAGVAGAPPAELQERILAGQANPLLVERESDFPALMKFTMSEPPYLPGPVMDVMARQRMANAALERQVFGQIAADSVNGSIGGLPTPALIVWGEQDRVLSAGTVPVLLGLLPHGRAIVMPGIGHLPMVERPQQVAEDYLRFRAGLASSAPD